MAGTAERVGMGRGEREEDGQESDPFHGGSPLTACGTMTIRCGHQTARITALAGAKMSRERCAYCVGPDRNRVAAWRRSGRRLELFQRLPCRTLHRLPRRRLPG